MHAYMAEFNLGVNGRECNRSRIVEGIEVILGAVEIVTDYSARDLCFTALAMAGSPWRSTKKQGMPIILLCF